MPTAVPATAPPSRLCTNFVPPMVFAKEVLGTFLFFIYMRPVLCLPKHTPKSKKYRADRPAIFSRFGVKESIRTLPQFRTMFSHVSGPNVPKIHHGRPTRALLGQSGGGGNERVPFCVISARKTNPLEKLLGEPFRPFFCSGLRDTTKRVSWRAFKNSPVFLTLLGSAQTASGGFPSTRELNFHFCGRTQKVLQNGSQNLRFWAPKSELY